MHANYLPELFQAEWCPSSQRVRMRLTELQVDVIVRQVEAEPEDRNTLAERSDQRTIPALVTGEKLIVGSDDILQHLESTYCSPTQPPSVAEHRDKAEHVRTKQLQKERSTT